MALYYYFLMVFGTCTFAFCHGMQLKKVLILSRHNIRTPLMNNFQDYSPKQWPSWEEPPAELTKKGGKQEIHLGRYFSEWLTSQNLFFGNCDDVYIYANVKQRTKETARNFAKGFNDCNIPVHFTSENVRMDPIFNPIIHNTSSKYLEEVKSAMKARIKEAELKDAYKEVYRIVDFKNAPLCKGGCAALRGESTPIVAVGMEPEFSGALRITNAVVDSFIMSYYNGFDMKNIAWGEMKSNTQWDLLTKISQENQNIRFRLAVSARDISKPLLKYMHKMLKEKKIVGLFGHDANLNAVIAALGFESFVLSGQKENAPIGAKLVFQKWNDGTNDLLKVEYVYQTWEQIRNGDKVTLERPPKNVTMHFSDMVEQGQGYYLWSDFIKRLEGLMQ